MTPEAAQARWRALRRIGSRAARIRAAQRAFLRAYRETWSVLRAARAVGLRPERHYQWLDDPWYRGRWQACQALKADVLEDAAFERAVVGIARGPRRVYSDRLLGLLLAGQRPERFGRRPADSSVNLSLTQVTVLSDRELRERLAGLIRERPELARLVRGILSSHEHAPSS